VTILFEIQMSVANLEQPLFVARDFHEGLFCKRLSATSAGALEKAWLSQHRIDSDPEISLSNMKGASFMGLDIPGFTNYLAGLVPSFQGARLREKERGRSKEDIGLRQKRRLNASLLEDFKAALGKACPDDLGRAFELLQSSQAFQTRFLPDMHYRFAQDDKSTQTLVDMYKEAVSKQDKKQAQWVLALYSPFHSQEHTMKLFQCAEHACKQANLLGEDRSKSIKPGDMVVFTAVLYNADANQDWLHSFVSLRACIVLLQERFPNIKTLRLRTDGAGNFRNSSFVLLMPKLSQWTGLRILEFSVSEAGGGKDLTDSLIMQQKQRIREGVKQAGGSARNATECVATVQKGEEQVGSRGSCATREMIFNRTSEV
jgi:hypothetical protein